MNWTHAISYDIDVAILAMAVACLLPYVFNVFAKLAGGFDLRYDNKSPREFFAKATGATQRLRAAESNSFESLPIFLIASVVAIYCLVPQHIVNIIAWLYVLLRVVYGVAYALDLAIFRSAIWFLSQACCLLLFYFAIRAF